MMSRKNKRISIDDFNNNDNKTLGVPMTDKQNVPFSVETLSMPVCVTLTVMC